MIVGTIEVLDDEQSSKAVEFVDKLEKMSKTYTDEDIRKAYAELKEEGKIQLNLQKKMYAKFKSATKKVDLSRKTLAAISKKKVSLSKIKTGLIKDNEEIKKLLAQIEKGAKDLGISETEVLIISKAEGVIKDNEIYLKRIEENL